MSRPAATRRDRPRFPEYEDEFGEDPSRFLYSGVDPQPRIRGIESIDLARAWMTVEIERPGGPRQQVVGWINQRITELEDEQPANASSEQNTIQA